MSGGGAPGRRSRLRRIGKSSRTRRASNPRGAGAGPGAGPGAAPGAVRAPLAAVPAVTVRPMISPDLVLDDVAQPVPDALERDAVEHRGEEALHDQALGLVARQAARHQVVHLL